MRARGGRTSNADWGDGRVIAGIHSPAWSLSRDKVEKSDKIFKAPRQVLTKWAGIGHGKGDVTAEVVGVSVSV
jgi:hypothetical protein